MIILSLYEVHNAAAALSIDGQVVGAELEERITGKKNQMGLPIQSALSLMTRFSIDPGMIDFVYILNRSFDLNGIANIALSRMSDYSVSDWYKENTYYWKPKLIDREQVAESYFSLMNDHRSSEPWSGHSIPYSFTDQLTDHIVNNEAAKASELFNRSRKDVVSRLLHVRQEKIKFVEHFLTHHYHAFYSTQNINSAKDDSLIVHAEGDGGQFNHAISQFSEQHGIQIIAGTNKFGIGRLYQWMTLFLKMKPYAHEYKMMGLAPFSEHLIDPDTIESINSYFEVNEDSLLANKQIPKDFYYTFADILKFSRFDVVASTVQNIVEHNLTKLFSSLSKSYKVSSFYYGGGVAMNVKANKSIFDLNEVNCLTVPFAPADEGNVLGACHYGFEKSFISSGKPLSLINENGISPYLGSCLNKDCDINEFKNEFEISTSHDVISKVANLLLNGYIGAIAKGQYEFGQRALGNRSIIGLPSTKGVVHKINTAIKMRDFWMPFAPSLIDIDASKVLSNYNPNCPYMSSSCEVNPKYHDLMDGALHGADKTCRPHIVSKSDNPFYYELLLTIKESTGIGCLVNTSFNIHNKPIVNNYSESINILRSSGLQFLILDKFLLIKK